MCLHKDGIFINGLEVTHEDVDWRLLAHDGAKGMVNVPLSGIPLNADSKLLRRVFSRGTPVAKASQAVHNSNALSYTSQFFEHGLFYERKKDRLSYLRFLKENARNRRNKDRADSVLKAFEAETRTLHDEFPLFVGLIADDGKMYVSGSGAFIESTPNFTVNGKPGLGELVSYLKSKGVPEAQLALVDSHLQMQEVPRLQSNVKLTEQAIRNTIGLTGLLLTIRGFYRFGRSAENVVAEWHLVAEPLLHALPNATFKSEELPWAFNMLADLVGVGAEQSYHLNKVAPYLTCSLGHLAGSSSSSGANSIALIAALDSGKWQRNNDRYAVTIKGLTVQIATEYTALISSALLIEKDVLHRAANAILNASRVYGLAAMGSTAMGSALYAEWIGITGVTGSTTVNISPN